MISSEQEDIIRLSRRLDCQVRSLMDRMDRLEEDASFLMKVLERSDSDLNLEVDE